MRFHVLRSCSLVLPVLTCLVVACNPDPDAAPGDDDGGAIDAGPSFDGGQPGTDGGHPGTDAGGSDAGSEGGSIGSGGITVKVAYQDLTPEVGADVYWFEDGQPVFHAVTDATGSAVHGVSHATNVTVLRHTTEYIGYHEIVTVLAAMPGDTLMVGNEGNPSVASIATVNADIPGNAGYAGATSYGEDMGDCISGATTQTGLPVTADFVASSCYKVGDAVDVLVSAYSGTGVAAFASKTTTLATAGSTVTFATGDWNATTAKAITITGTPPTWAQSVGAGASFASPVGANYAGQGAGVSFPADLTTLAVSYAVPPITTTVMRPQLYAQGSLGIFSAQSSIYRHAAPTDAIALDYGQLLPKLAMPTVGGTASTPSISWTPDSAIANGSLGIVHLTAPPGDAGGTIDWRIVFPTNGNTITPPTLPDVSAFQPGGAWKVKDVSVSTGAVDYATLRKAPTETPQRLIFAVGAAAGDVQTTTTRQ